MHNLFMRKFALSLVSGVLIFSGTLRAQGIAEA